MKQVKRGKRKATRFKSNPFLYELGKRLNPTCKFKEAGKEVEVMVDLETGENINIFKCKKVIKDKAQFAFLYMEAIKEWYELSKPAIIVFLHLTLKMDFNNLAYFDYRRQHADVGYDNYLCCYKAIVELEQKDFIAYAEGEYSYWINNSIMGKGNRFAKYIEYIHDSK